MPLEELTVGEDLTYQEYPMKILDTSEKVTRNNRYKMCKVQWSNHTEEEATWEKRRSAKGRVSRYLFQSVRISGVRFILRGVGL
jgi:hypothetical protein